MVHSAPGFFPDPKTNFAQITNSFKQYHHVTIPMETLYSKRQIDLIKRSFDKPSQEVTGGTTDEFARFSTTKLRTDEFKDWPRIQHASLLDAFFGWRVLHALANGKHGKAKRLFRRLVNGEFYLRDIQARTYPTNGGIGPHVDADSNPFDKAAVIFHFSQEGVDYTGGAFEHVNRDETRLDVH